MQPTYEIQEALDQATVVIDCTPDGVANQHKRDWFQHMPTTTGFLAQGARRTLASRMHVASTMERWCLTRTASFRS